MSVQGLTKGCGSMNDTNIKTTFLKSQATIMNVSLSSLTYQSCNQATSRRSLIGREVNSASSSPSYNLATQVVIILTNVDTTKSNSDTTAAANAAFIKLSTKLSSAVQSGSFAAVMQATAKSLGVATFNVSSSLSSGLQVTVYTYSPTTTPTTFKPIFSLSEMPSTENNNNYPSLSPTEKSSTLSTGAIIGIVVGVVALILIIAGLYLYYTKYYNNNKKERQVYVENIEEN